MTVRNTFFVQQSTEKYSLNVEMSKKDRAVEKIRLLSRQIFPLTNAYTNSQSQKIQLWSTPNLQPIGSITDPGGKVLFVSPMRIHNPLNLTETPTDLYMRLLLAPEDCEWTFAKGTDGSLTIWPRLKAAGWQDAIPISQDKCSRVDRLFRGKSQTEACEWFYNNGFQVIANRESPRENPRIELFHPSNPSKRFLMEANHLSQKIKISTRETYEHNRRADAMSRFIVRTGRTSVLAAVLLSNSLFGKTPANEQFRQILQQTHLTGSYNGSHPGKPIPARGSTSGQIGGVGHKLGMIEGLFDHPEALFEREHYFMVPMEGGNLPFSYRELQQILRELAIGIYAHDAVPFFSLEFNQDSHLFPVIHPVYEGTLVGRVIGMLDYMMKGYLNGGIFSEEFVDDWRASQHWDRTSALEDMISFEEYIRNDCPWIGKDYQPLQTMVENYLKKKKNKLSEKGEEIPSEDSAFFEDYTNFSNSFRIIAKQSSFKRGESLFLLDGDFDVFYTLQPDPEYQRRLDAFRSEFGRDPLGYAALDKCAQKMCDQIHDKMKKLPLFQEYFSMLNVINFFSSYFKTLKTHDTIPYLAPMPLEKKEEKRCPSVFPELPILVKEKSKVREHSLISQLRYEHFNEIENYLMSGSEEVPAKLKDAIKELVWKDLTRKKTVSLSQSLFGGAAVPPLAMIPLAFGGMITPITNHMNRGRYALLSGGIAASFYLYSNAKWYFSEERKTQNRYLSDRVKFDRELDEFIVNFLNDLKVKFYGFKMRHPEFSGDRRTLIGQFFDQNKGDFKSYLDTKMWGDESHLTREDQQDVSLSVLKPAIDAEIQDKQIARNVVGGCGMDLEAKKVTESEEAKEIFKDKWPKLFHEKEETWTITDIPHTYRKGAVFRLMIGQSPVDQNDYQWMENLIHLKRDRSEKLEEFYGVVEAMMQDNSKLFTERLKTITSTSFVERLTRCYSLQENIRDRMGRTLFHISATLQKTDYSKFLYSNHFSERERDVHGFIPMHYAAMEGNVDQINFLARCHSEAVSTQSYSGLTPLMVAVQHGRLDAVDALRRLGSRLDGVTMGGYTPLMIAVHEGNFAMTEYLLNQTGVNVNVETGRKVTPLMLAAELKDPRFVQLLLEKRANPNAQDRGGNKALNVAIQSRNIENIRILASRTSYTEKTGSTLAQYGTEEIFRAFLDSRPSNREIIDSINEGIEHANWKLAVNGIDFLLQTREGFQAVNEAFQDSVETLFEKRAFAVIEKLIKAHIHFSSEKMIKGICFAGDHPLSRRYLKESVDWIAIEPSFILESFEMLLNRGHISLLPTFLEATGLELNGQIFHGNPWEYPHFLAKMDGRDLLRDWIEETDDCLYPVKSEGNMTLAYIAAKEGSYYTLEYLLEYMEQEGISLENHYKDHHLLVGAFMSYDEKVILRTLQFCSDLNQSLDANGKRAAHFAAKQNRIELLQEIVRRKGRVNIQDNQGKTPLYEACFSGSFEAAEYLIKQGCPIDETDTEAVRNLPDVPVKKKLKNLLNITGPQRETSPSFTLTEMLDRTSIERFMEASPLDKISIAQTLPLEKMLPPNEAKLSVPLIFYLVKLCSHAPDIYQQEIIPLIQSVQEQFPNLRDSRGNTLSHYLILLNLAACPEIEVDLKATNSQRQTPLHIASVNAKDKIFEELVSRADSDDLEAMNNRGETPLFDAVRKDRLFPLNLLLQRKVNVNHRNHLNQLPFSIALSKKNSRVLLTLLQYCDVDQELRIPGENLTTTPLRCLAASKFSEAFIHALKAHPIAGAKIIRRQTIPNILAQNGDLESIRHMMMVHQELFFEKQEGFYPWDWAAFRGHLSILEYFFSEIPNLFHYGEDLLKYAALGGQKDVAVYLVNKGILDHLSEKEKQNALSAAACSNCKETAKFFTDLFIKTSPDNRLFKGIPKAIPSGIQSNKVNSLSQFYEGVEFPIGIELENQKPGLHLAASIGAFEATKYLMSHRDIDPTQRATRNGFTALECAAEGENAAQFRYLLEKTLAPIDQQNENGQTLLHITARNGRFPHTMLLLTQGYTPNIQDSFGLTPQEIAAIEGRYDILRLLLFAGADEASIRRIIERAEQEVAKRSYLTPHYEGVLKVIEEFNAIYREASKDQTALHLAIKTSWKPALTVLAQTDLLNEPDARGFTPLHLAAAIDDTESLRILIINGADLMIKDHQGRTAEALAAELKKEEALKIFREIKEGEYACA